MKKEITYEGLLTTKRYYFSDRFTFPLTDELTIASKQYYGIKSVNFFHWLCDISIDTDEKLSGHKLSQTRLNHLHSHQYLVCDTWEDN